MNNSLFEIGQKVVCVDSSGHNVGLIEGKVYTVNGIKKAPCCGTIVIDVGIKTRALITYCACGGKYDADGWKRQTRFVPLDTNKQLEDEIHSAINEDLKIKNFQDN